MDPDVPVPTRAEWQGPEPVYAALRPVVEGAARVLFRIHVEGLERIPGDGPVLLLPNHVSHLDPLVLFSVCGRAGRVRPRFLALADLWEVRGLGLLLREGHMIPVFRGRGEEAARHLQDAGGAALDAGQLVVVYPEGRLPQPGVPQRPRRGAGALALDASGVPVVPVAMLGVPSWTGGLPRLRAPVTVRVGEPLDLRDLRARTRTPDVERAASTRALAAIAELSS